MQTFKVHEHLRPKLCDLYENDCIFDKFQATWSGDDKFELHTAMFAPSHGPQVRHDGVVQQHLPRL